MARPNKPAWRRVLNGRYLKRWVADRIVRLWPRLGRQVGYFPRLVDLIEAADRVLADTCEQVPQAWIDGDMAFLERALPNDSVDSGLDLRTGVSTGQRTVLIRAPWLDMRSGAILLPERERTVLARGVGNWNAGSVAWRRERVRMSGRIVAPLPSANYFHLLLEGGIWLSDLLASGLVADAPRTIVKQPDRNRVEAALYRGIAAHHGVEVRHVPPPALVIPDEIVCHFPRNRQWEWPPFDRAQVDRLAGIFDDVYGESPAVHGRDLFLCRGDAKLRRLVNEEEIAERLGAIGFERFVAADDNHPEQIARFRAARRVVAVHGAGLANLLFCRPGAQVVEIFPENAVKSTYWWLCKVLDLEHCPVIGTAGDYHLTFGVDADGVLAALER